MPQIEIGKIVNVYNRLPEDRRSLANCTDPLMRSFLRNGETFARYRDTLGHVVAELPMVQLIEALDNELPPMPVADAVVVDNDSNAVQETES